MNLNMTAKTVLTNCLALLSRLTPYQIPTTGNSPVKKVSGVLVADFMEQAPGFIPGREHMLGVTPLVSPAIIVPFILGALKELATVVENIEIPEIPEIPNHPYPLTRQATVASGVATFYLTVENTAGGTPFFPEGDVTAQAAMFRARNATLAHTYGESALSENKKVLTVPVKRTAVVQVLSINVLGAKVDANGSVIDMTIFGR